MNRRAFTVWGGVTAWLWAGAAAHAAMYELEAGVDVIGDVRVIAARYEDTFIKLARTHNLGYQEIRKANPDVDAWLPGEGTPVTLPTQYVLPNAPREGIVINIAEHRLYYFPDGEAGRVFTYPIGVARMERSTPLGLTQVTRKAVNPTWYPPESIREEHAARGRPLPAVVPPGPANPLGTRALYLGFPAYLIHGTNEPRGIGMRVSAGCIRMFPEDVEELYKMVPVGTPVRIVNQPYKLGWGADGLYLEAHPPLEEERDTGQWTPTELTRLVVAATDERDARVRVRWDIAEDVMHEANGIPRFILTEPFFERDAAEDEVLTVEVR
jgi:L,D-transpeptidase ErfK/SrfK